jgi:hypothetical protein
MAGSDVLLKPEECVMLLVDFQAGLGFGVESIPTATRAQQCCGIGTNRGCFQSSRHRIHIRIARLQRSLASGVAGGASVRKSYRAKKHECLGR